MNKYYVTTAIDYVNAPPHIGHAYEKIAADIVARFWRLSGREVYFLTGTDEHGTKIEKTAKAAGKEPQAFCDEIAGKFQEAWTKLDLSNDYFIRTTEERHKKVVQEVFRKMREKGDVYKNKYAGFYCEGCEDHLRERDLDENGHCPTHKRKPSVFEEENYFFRLTKYKDALRKWLKETPDVVKPDFRLTEVLNQLDDPELGDFSISRSRSALQWGIGVPDDPDQVIYVWIDALTNYITGVGYLNDETQWSKMWPADLHLIGKDILKFHAIYWPAMLMSIDVPLPRQVYGHGFITVEGQKMSKTLGNVLDPIDLANKYPVDAIRFFLFQSNSFAMDADFSTKAFIAQSNSHLANNLGNLLNRTLTLVDKNCGGTVPDVEPDKDCLAVAASNQALYLDYMARLEFSKAIEHLLLILNEANRYINDQKPWALFKEGKNAEGAQVLRTSLELIRTVAPLLHPFCPTLTNKIWDQLGYTGRLEDYKLVGAPDRMPAGQALRNSGPVFLRLEDTEAAVAK